MLYFGSSGGEVGANSKMSLFPSPIMSLSPTSVGWEQTAREVVGPLLIPYILSSQEPRAFLVAQTVKNLPAMQETWVRSLGWEYPLEKEHAEERNTVCARQDSVQSENGVWCAQD